MLKELFDERQKLEVHRDWVRERAVEHYQRKHHGFPVTSCHRCVDLSMGMRAAKIIIAELKEEINQMIECGNLSSEDQEFLQSIESEENIS